MGRATVAVETAHRKTTKKCPCEPHLVIYLRRSLLYVHSVHFAVGLQLHVVETEQLPRLRSRYEMYCEGEGGQRTQQYRPRGGGVIETISDGHLYSRANSNLLVRQRFELVTIHVHNTLLLKFVVMSDILVSTSNLATCSRLG